MADVREETTLELVQFDELTVGLLQRLPVLIQFVTQTKFPKPQNVVKIISRHHDDRGQGQEVKVVEHHAGFALVVGKKSGSEIQAQRDGDGNQTLRDCRLNDRTRREDDKVQASVVVGVETTRL